MDMTLITVIAASVSSLTVIAIMAQRKSQTAKHYRPEYIEQLAAQEVSSQVAYYIAHGERLKAIKAYRIETGVGLKEAVHYIDKITFYEK